MAETETERKLRIRAEQAEAEVRSLKRTRHERSDRAEVTTRVETSRLDFGTQTDSHETEIAEPRERLKNTPAPSEGSPVSEIEELRQQLKQRDSAIVQLQADRNREQHTKQRKASEETTLCREELCEMTQRAESLMEQLRKSKKRGGELQAARELAREEFLTCRSELQECQATLRRQVVRSDGSEPTYESREARGSLRSSEKESDVTTSLMDSKDTAPIGEEFTLRPPEWKGAPGQARLSQCFGTLRKLHHELSKELQSRSKSQGKPEDVVSKLLQQMDKALQLDGPSPVGSEGRAVAVSLSGLRQPSSPEAERPLPEDLKDFKLSTSSASAGSPQPRDSEEVLLMKLDVNAVRVAAELEKKKLMDQHCDDMDDLLRRHNKERRELHQELVELRSEQLRSEAHETLVKPMQDIRAHFEKQVAEVKHGLKAELADIHEQNRMLNGQVEQEMSLLRRDLERSQGELFASKHQFRELEGLYDKEHSELLRLRQQQRELMEKEEQAKAAAAEAAANTFDVQQAEANATLSGDFSHDTATAILPVGVAPTLERSQERPEGKEDQVSGSNNTTLLADDSQQTAHPQVNSSIPSPLPAPNSAMKQVMMAPKPKEDGREAMTPTVLSTRKAARPSVTAVSTVLRTIPSQGRPATVQTRSAPQLPTPSTPHGVRPVLSAGPAQLHRLTNTPTTTTLIQHHHRSLSSASG